MSSRRNLVVSILLTMTSLSVTARLVAQDPGDVQQFDRLHKQYLAHFQRGQWQPAYDAANRLVAYVRSSSLGVHYEIASWECIGDSGRKAGKFREAMAAYQQLVAAARQWRPTTNALRALVPQAMATGLIGVANCYLVQGPIEQAVNHYEQAIGVLKQNHFDLEAAGVLAGLGTALSRGGQPDRALQEFKHVIAVLGPAIQRGQTTVVVNLQEAYADALLGASKVHSNRGRFDLAEPYSRQAVNALIAAKGEQHPFVAKAMADLADLYTRQNRLEEANALFTAAIDNFAAVSALDSPYALNALENYAGLLHDAGQAANAEKIARHVLEKYRVLYGDDDLSVAHALLSVGNAVNLQGRHAEAEGLVQQALAMRDRLSPANAATAPILLSLASIQYELGKHQEGLVSADRALALDKQYPLDPGVLAKAHGSRSLHLWKLNRRPEAREALAESLQYLEVVRAGVAGAERERAVLFGDFKVFYEVLASWQAEDDDLPGMFQTMETAKARSLLDELRLGDTDLFAGIEPEKRARLQQQDEELRRQLTAAQQQFDALIEESAPATPDRAERQQAAAAEVHAARAALYQHLADIRSDSPAYRDSITGSNQTRSLVDVQQTLAVDEVLISYLFSEEDSIAVVVRKDRASLTKLMLDRDQAKKLGVEPGNLNAGKLRSILLGEQGVMARLSTSQSHENANSQLLALWQALIPEAERKSLTDHSVKLLTIVPDGLLSLLPFEALITAESVEPQYLLDVGPPVNYAPSASVLLNLRERQSKQDSAREPILTLGDPRYAQTRPVEDELASRHDVRSGDQRFRSTLSRLPFSGNEASWLKEHFAKHGLTSLKLSQAQATEARLRSSVAGRQIVHLACHGMADASYGNLFGCLALAPGKAADPGDDGFLYAAEISDLDLGACELAILSACQTNFGPQQTGEGVWTLSRAFLVAGARRVIASNWLVDDESGATLVSYLAAYLAESGGDLSSRNYARALQQAKQQLRKQTRWAHPFYWSNLVLVGPK